jgi:hypothetical protein
VTCPLREGDPIAGAHPDRFSGRIGPMPLVGVVVKVGEPDGTRWGWEFDETDAAKPDAKRWWRTVDDTPGGKRWRVTISTREQGWRMPLGPLRDREVLWPLG